METAALNYTYTQSMHSRARGTPVTKPMDDSNTYVPMDDGNTYENFYGWWRAYG